MEEVSFIKTLLEYGSLGIFAAFLVWQHLSMQKRLDKLLDKFQQQLAAIQAKSEANEDKLRDRYDSVVETYRSDKANFRDNVADQVKDSIRTLEEIREQIKGLPFESIQIQIEGLSLNQRNSHLILEKGMEKIKKLEEEQKIRAMARKFSDQDKNS